MHLGADRPESGRHHFVGAFRPSTPEPNISIQGIDSLQMYVAGFRLLPYSRAVVTKCRDNHHKIESARAWY